MISASSSRRSAPVISDGGVQFGDVWFVLIKTVRN